MDKVIEKYWCVPFNELNYCPNEGIMYQRDMTLSVEYDKDYFNKYINYENTSIANKINHGRTSITEKYCNSILDIGIGSGEFIKSSKIKTYGFDINSMAIDWLKEKDIFANPYEKMPDVTGLTFWDSLEHIPKPSDLLSLIPSNFYIFISMPIISDLIRITENKHYKPNEHYYYFTSNGMIKWMKDSNFSLIEMSDFETKSGREEITTFVFKKN